MKWDKEAQRLFDEGLDFACVSGVSGSERSALCVKINLQKLKRKKM